MFVRWQSRKRRHPAFGGPGKQIRGGDDWAYTRPGTSEQDKHWAAILVERVRVEGRSTQRHVAYLGGVTDSAIEIAAQRMFFWDDVKQRLDRLSNRIRGCDCCQGPAADQETTRAMHPGAAKNFRQMTTLAAVRRAALRSLIPPPQLALSDWTVSGGTHEP